MEQIFSVLLMICGAEDICTKDNAKVFISGMFVNNGESKTPCEDWLTAQLEFNMQIKGTQDWNNLGFYFQCKPKEK